MKRGLEIRDKYDRTYKTYDELYKEEQLEKYFIALRRVRPKGRILDLGCGTALLLEFLYINSLVDNVTEYVCLDYSLGMLRIAARRAEDICRGSCHFILADAENLPFNDNTFDIVYSFTVLDLLDDPERGILEAIRVSKDLVVVSVIKRLETWKKLKVPVKIIGETDKDAIFLINKLNISRK